MGRLSRSRCRLRGLRESREQAAAELSQVGVGGGLDGSLLSGVVVMGEGGIRCFSCEGICKAARGTVSWIFHPGTGNLGNRPQWQPMDR